MAKAKTAYELLERVCEAIKANPLNYAQEWWAFKREADGGGFCDLPSELDVPENKCGTAYCRAGWIVFVNDGANTGDAWSISNRANAILGMSGEHTIALFRGDAVDGNGKPGTRNYVRAGVRGVRAFMKTHATHLKARKLRGV